MAALGVSFSLQNDSIQEQSVREQANSLSLPELSQEQGACLASVLGHCARHWDDSRPQGKLVSPGEVLQQGFWEREEVPAVSQGSFSQAQGAVCAVPSPFLPG